MEEGELGFGEEGGGFGVIVGAEGGVELFQEGGEFFLGHR